MRVLFLTFSSAKSHLFLQTPIASALRTAGHEVRVAGSPDLLDDIANAGHVAVPIGLDMTEAMAELDEEWEPEKPAEPAYGPGEVPTQRDYAREDPHRELAYLTENWLRHVIPEPMLDDLVRYARFWRPDLVVWDQLCFAGAVAAKACGAAQARFLWGTDGIEQLRAGARAQYAGRADAPADPLAEWLRPTLERYGCTYDEDVITGQWTIDTMPSWTWHPRGARYVPVRQVPYNGPSWVPQWLREPPARRRIAVTLGVTLGANGLAEASTADLFAAVGDLDAEVVVTMTPEQAGAGPVPANVRLAGFVPTNALLPTCDAVIHHGGAGTFAAALEHGVPQLIVPSSFWSVKWYCQVAFGEGLQEQGAGVLVAPDSDHLRPENLREHIVRVLKEPSFAEQAARLRTESLATPAPNEIVTTLERLTAAHRPAQAD